MRRYARHIRSKYSEIPTSRTLKSSRLEKILGLLAREARPKVYGVRNLLPDRDYDKWLGVGGSDFTESHCGIPPLAAPSTHKELMNITPSVIVRSTL